MKEANAREATGARVEALDGVGFPDATEGEDRGRGGGGAGCAEGGEAESGPKQMAVDALLKDGTEEQEVRGSCLEDLRDGVAGDADERRGSAGGGPVESRAGLLDGLGVRAAGEVHAIGTCRGGDVSGSVEEDAETRAGGLTSTDGCEDARGEGFELLFGKVLLSNLEEGHSASEETGGPGDELVCLGGLISRKVVPVGDGVAEDGLSLLFAWRSTRAL